MMLQTAPQQVMVSASQLVAGLGTVTVLFVGALLTTLKYYFEKDNKSTNERFTAMEARFDRFETTIEEIRDQFLDEVRSIERRVAQVELDQVKHYVTRSEYDAAVQRLHGRFDDRRP